MPHEKLEGRGVKRSIMGVSGAPDTDRDPWPRGDFAVGESIVSASKSHNLDAT